MFYRHGREGMIKTLFEKKKYCKSVYKKLKENASDNITNEDVIINYRWSNEDPNKNRGNENRKILNVRDTLKKTLINHLTDLI